MFLDIDKIHGIDQGRARFVQACQIQRYADPSKFGPDETLRSMIDALWKKFGNDLYEIDPKKKGFLAKPSDPVDVLIQKVSQYFHVNNVTAVISKIDREIEGIRKAVRDSESMDDLFDNITEMRKRFDDEDEQIRAAEKELNSAADDSGQTQTGPSNTHKQAVNPTKFQKIKAKIIGVFISLVNTITNFVQRMKDGRVKRFLLELLRRAKAGLAKSKSLQAAKPEVAKALMTDAKNIQDQLNQLKANESFACESFISFCDDMLC